MSITSYPPNAGVTAPPLNRQVFTGPTGTWTKPPGAQRVLVQIVGGGGGGASGRVGATGTVRSGGPGGAAGVYAEAWFNATDLPQTVACVAGTGGTGGASVPGPDQTGAPGGTGNDSTFGTFLRGLGTFLVSQGGGISTGVGGKSWFMAGALTDTIPSFGAGCAGGNNNTPGRFKSFGNNGMPNQPVGGAAGGTVLNSTTGQTGGDGWVNEAMNDANFPVGGAVGGGNATPVAVPLTLADVKYGCIPYYGGAGGGAGTADVSSITGATGGNGSDGQGYGAGGGGGGGTVNGWPSGIGGRGANGVVIVTSYT